MVERAAVPVVRCRSLRRNAAVARDDRDGAVAAAAVGAEPVDHGDARARTATKLADSTASDWVHRVKLAAVGVAELRQRHGVCAGAAAACRGAAAGNLGQVARSCFGTASEVAEADQRERAVNVADSKRHRARSSDPHAAPAGEIKRGELTEPTLRHHRERAAMLDMVRAVLVVMAFDVDGGLVAKDPALRVVVLEVASLLVMVVVVPVGVHIRRVVPKGGGRGEGNRLECWYESVGGEESSIFHPLFLVKLLLCLLTGTPMQTNQHDDHPCRTQGSTRQLQTGTLPKGYIVWQSERQNVPGREEKGKCQIKEF